jgi:transposase-like protein
MAYVWHLYAQTISYLLYTEKLYYTCPACGESFQAEDSTTQNRLENVAKWSAEEA